MDGLDVFLAIMRWFGRHPKVLGVLILALIIIGVLQSCGG